MFYAVVCGRNFFENIQKKGRFERMGTVKIEDFDFDAMEEEVKKSLKKPNILICGATGVGKSSLVNDIFGEKTFSRKAEVGKDAGAKTRGVQKFSSDDAAINLYDSEGYEIGTIEKVEESEYYKSILGFIDKEKSKPIEHHIHEVWYCVGAGGKRFHEIDKKIIEEILLKNVKVMIVLTKVDLVDEEELRELKNTVRRELKDIAIFTYSIEISKDSEDFGTYVQKEEMIEWALDNLDDVFTRGMISEVDLSIEKKRDLIIKKTVSTYVALAIGTVLATSFIPVPFTDSFALMGLQTSMAMKIFGDFGIKTELSTAMKGFLGTGTISYFGRTVATQLFSIVPGVGQATKVAVNTSVAASVTAILGVSITIIVEQYFKLIKKDGGKDAIPFSEFLTKERFQEAMNYVKENQELFNIEKIIKLGKEKKEKTK